MATTTLTLLRTAVRNRMGRPSSDDFLTDAVLTDVINEALQAYSVEADWPWLVTTETITTAADTGGYNVASNWMKTKSVYQTNYDSLFVLSLEEILGITTSGVPQAYRVEGSSMLMRPIPDAVYSFTHYYYRTEPALVNTSDAPLIPEAFVHTLTHLAAAFAYMREGNFSAAEQCKTDYSAWLERMFNYKRRSGGGMVPIVRPGSEFP